MDALVKKAARPIPARLAFSILIFIGFVAVTLWLIFRAPLPQYWEAVFALIAAPAGWVFLHSGNAALVERLLAPFLKLNSQARLGLLAALLLALLFVAGFILDGFPNSSDEYVYVLQAQTYALGRLWVDAPPLPDSFMMLHMLVKDGIWISQYQPGWPIFMTPAAWLGVPLWLVNPMLAVALIASFFAVARRQVSLETSWLATIALASSAFFIFNAASYFSHVATALWGLLFAFFALRYLEDGDVKFAAIAGAFIGLMGNTRVFDAAVFIGPFVVALIFTRQRRTGLFWFGLGGAPFFLLYLAFNYAVTGDALMNLPAWYSEHGEPVGAPTARTVKLAVMHFARVMIWTSPLVILGFAAAFAHLAKQRRLSFLDWIAPAIVTAYMFYGGHGGNQWGPRYYFEAFPFAILTIAKSLDGTLFTKAWTPRSALVASALVAHLAFQVGHLTARLPHEHLVILGREDVYRKVKAAKLTNAVVIIATEAGRIRPMQPFDLTRNGLRIGAASVIYALDRGAQNAGLRALFPNRQFYRYSYGNLEPMG